MIDEGFLELLDRVDEERKLQLKRLTQLRMGKDWSLAYSLIEGCWSNVDMVTRRVRRRLKTAIKARQAAQTAA